MARRPVDTLEEDFRGKAYDGRIVGRLLVYIRPYWWMVLAAVIIMSSTSLVALGRPWIFSRIVDVRDMEYESKPQPSAYVRICELLGVEPEECMLVEDNVRNLCPAKEIGMSTVLVGDGSQSQDRCVDHALDQIEQIGSVLAEIDSSSPGSQL